MPKSVKLAARQQIGFALRSLDRLEKKYTKKSAKATGEVAASIATAQPDIQAGLEKARASLRQALQNLQ